MGPLSRVLAKNVFFDHRLSLPSAGGSSCGNGKIFGVHFIIGPIISNWGVELFKDDVLVVVVVVLVMPPLARTGIPCLRRGHRGARRGPVSAV